MFFKDWKAHFMEQLLHLLKGGVLVVEAELVVARFVRSDILFVWFASGASRQFAGFQFLDGLEGEVQQFGGLVAMAFQVKE